jgi:hypothetical protein
MRIIPTRVHGMLDYLMGILVAASPWLFGFADGGATATIHLVLGGGILAAAALTDFELGLVPLIPMPVHLALDAAIGVLALASPWLFDLQSYVALHVLLGVFEIGAAAMTSTRPAARIARA